MTEPMIGLSHGSRFAYGCGCRCEPCRTVENDYQNSLRSYNYSQRAVVSDGGTQRYVAPVPDERHGRLGTYTNLGCRCEPCTNALREYTRTRRAERRQRAELEQAFQDARAAAAALPSNEYDARRLFAAITKTA